MCYNHMVIQGSYTIIKISELMKQYYCQMMKIHPLKTVKIVLCLWTLEWQYSVYLVLIKLMDLNNITYLYWWKIILAFLKTTGLQKWHWIFILDRFCFFCAVKNQGPSLGIICVVWLSLKLLFTSPARQSGKKERQVRQMVVNCVVSSH